MTGEWLELMNDFSPRNINRIARNIDKEVGLIAKDIAEESSANAPVDTGYMRDTLKVNYKRTGNHLESEWQVMPDVYEVLPYLWVQNFNHRTKGFFFTTAFNKQHGKFDKRLIKILEDSFK